MNETWLPVAGWEGLYEVSSLGRVRTIRRQGSDGRIMAQHVSRWGYLNVHLTHGHARRTRTAHILVGEAFLGPRPEGMETRHLDGNPANNAVDNLQYGTKSQNAQDRIRHGHHENTLKTHCPQGHPYDEANMHRTPDGRQRYCLTCKREKTRAYRLSHRG